MGKWNNYSPDNMSADPPLEAPLKKLAEDKARDKLDDILNDITVKMVRIEKALEETGDPHLDRWRFMKEDTLRKFKLLKYSDALIKLGPWYEKYGNKSCSPQETLDCFIELSDIATDLIPVVSELKDIYGFGKAVTLGAYDEALRNSDPEQQLILDLEENIIERKRREGNQPRVLIKRPGGVLVPLEGSLYDTQKGWYVPSSTTIDNYLWASATTYSTSNPFSESGLASAVGVDKVSYDSGALTLNSYSSTGASDWSNDCDQFSFDSIPGQTNQTLQQVIDTIKQQINDQKAEIEKLKQRSLLLEQRYQKLSVLPENKGIAGGNQQSAIGGTGNRTSPPTAVAAKQEKEKANSLFEFIAESGEEAWAKVSASAKQHLQNVLRGTESFSHAFKSIWNEMVKEVKKLLLEKLYQAWLKPLLDGVVNWLAGMIGARADGGPVESQTAYVVGEEGPELFVPHSSGTIIPNGRLALSPAYWFGAQGEAGSVGSGGIIRGASAPLQQGGAPPVKIVVVNNTGTQAEVKQSEPQFNGEEWVIGVVLDAYARDRNGMRTVFSNGRA